MSLSRAAKLRPAACPTARRPRAGSSCAAIARVARLPCARTLRRSLADFPAKTVPGAVEAAYLAGLPHRAGRVWVALDAHQVSYWGRGRLARFQKGWSGWHSRRLRGYRLYLAVATDTGQVITFALARGRLRDHRPTALLARRVSGTIVAQGPPDAVTNLDVWRQLFSGQPADALGV